MKTNKFIYIFLILLSGMLYSFSGNSFLFLLSGFALCGLIVSGNVLSAVIASLLSLVYCILFNSSFDIATMFCICGVLPGILLGYAYKKSLPTGYLITIPACGFASGWVYLFFSYKSAGGENMFEAAVSLVDKNFDNALAVIVQQYGDKLDPETVKQLSQTMSSTLEVFLQMVPCMIILYSCFMALLLVWFTKKSAVLYGCKKPASFSEFYAPGSVSILIFVCLACVFLVKNNYSYFFMNLLVLFLCYYMLCGLSLADYYFRKLLPSGGIRALIYAFVLFTGSLLLPQLLWTLLMMAGMADVLFDFRKLRPQFTDFEQ